MSADTNFSLDQMTDRASLARALANHLRHLQEYHGLAYVSGAALPKRTSSRSSVDETSTAGPESQAPQLGAAEHVSIQASATGVDATGTTDSMDPPARAQPRDTDSMDPAARVQPGAIERVQADAPSADLRGTQPAHESSPNFAVAGGTQGPHPKPSAREPGKMHAASFSGANDRQVHQKPPLGPGPSAAASNTVASAEMPRDASSSASDHSPQRSTAIRGVAEPRRDSTNVGVDPRGPLKRRGDPRRERDPANPRRDRRDASQQNAHTKKPARDPRGGSPAPKKPAASEARNWPPARKLEYLRYHIGDCQRCRLAATRTTIVFGSGNPEAQVMFVGEAPGADEDRQGIPFVGPAGQRLNHMLRELGLERHQVYIANVLKCRPPRNRDPKPDEVNVCSKFLEAQIRAIQPQVLIALGRHAGMLMLRRDLQLREMRGRAWTYEQPAANLKIPLYITYHPSYVLRRESDARRQGGNVGDVHAMVVNDLRRSLSVIRADTDRDG